MAWITLTEARLQNLVSAPELSALKTAAKDGSQTGAGILSAAITGVVNFVRSYCPAAVQRGEGETIPDEAEHVALAILRNRMFSRLPGLAAQFYDEHRQTEYREAMDWLKRWSRDEVRVVPPETPANEAEQAGGVGVEVVNNRTRTVSRETLAGL